MSYCCPPYPVNRPGPHPCQPVVSQGCSVGTICCYNPCVQPCPPPCPPPCYMPCPPPCQLPCNPCCQNLCPPDMIPSNIMPLYCYNPCCLPPGSVILDSSQIPTLPGCGW